MDALNALNPIYSSLSKQYNELLDFSFKSLAEFMENFWIVDSLETVLVYGWPTSSLTFVSHNIGIDST